MPTNSPILPFLVLTMAGGCGVSNLMKRAGNNSWVCVQTGLEGGGKREGGDARGGEVESRHWCPCQNEGQRARERAALTATTSPKWLPVKAPEKKETLRAWITAVTPLWLTGVSSCEVPQRQAWLQSARASWNGQQGWALGLWGPPVCYRRIWRLNWGGGQECTTSVTPNLIGFWTVYLFPHVFIPVCSLSLFDWVRGLGLDYPRRGCEPRCVCLHTRTSARPDWGWLRFGLRGWKKSCFN